MEELHHEIRALRLKVTLETPIGPFTDTHWFDVPGHLTEEEAFDYVMEYLEDEGVSYNLSY